MRFSKAEGLTLLLVATFDAIVLPSCSGGLPGTILGTFKVVAHSQTDSCGPGDNAPGTWTFNVELSKQASTLYWSWLDRRPLLSSPVSDAGAATFESRVTGNVDVTPEGGPGRCTLERVDSLTIALGPGSPPTAFSGSLQYRFVVANGADCTDQLSASGGTYAALPCTIAYALQAGRQ